MSREQYLKAAGFALVLVGLWYISSRNYLLFHTFVESFSIVVAFGIFMIAWNTRSIVKSDFLLFLGLAYLYVGALDFLHMLAYPGLNVFQIGGINVAAQLWLSARFLESTSLLIAPFFLTHRVKAAVLHAIYLPVALALVGTVFYWRTFPDCFVLGVGLTPFKKISEYAICLVLAGAIAALLRCRKQLPGGILRRLGAAILLTIASELAFTLYTDPYAFQNFVGHILKFTSFFLIYRALIESGLRSPYDTLFRDLRGSETALRAETVRLEKALSQVNTLEGILPTCMYCKKIRDSQGSWVDIHEYVHEHSEADFSHGLCPDCRQEHYPGTVNSS